MFPYSLPFSCVFLGSSMCSMVAGDFLESSVAIGDAADLVVVGRAWVLFMVALSSCW